MTIEAIGDHALVRNVGELKLVGPRGVLARWALTEHDDDGEVDFFGDIVSDATLADPPRFALLRMTGRRVQRRIARIEQSWLEVIDPMSGALHMRVDAPLLWLLAFEPAGTVLFAESGSSLVVVDDGGRARQLDDGHRFRRIAFSPNGSRAVVGEPGVPGRVAGVALDNIDAPVVTWRCDVNALGFAVSDDGTCIALVQTDAGVRALRSIDREGLVATLPNAAEPSRPRATLSAFHANRAFDRVAYVDEDVLTTWRSGADGKWSRTQARLGVDIEIDVERDRVLESGVGVYLRDLAGALIRTSAYATRMCFAGTGPAAVLVGGAVHTLDETGTHLIDGPGNLVDIATHPRGVVALDDKDCAHVVEVPA